MSDCREWLPLELHDRSDGGASLVPAGLSLWLSRALPAALLESSSSDSVRSSFAGIDFGGIGGALLAIDFSMLSSSTTAAAFIYAILGRGILGVESARASSKLGGGRDPTLPPRARTPRGVGEMFIFSSSRSDCDRSANNV